MRIAPILLAAGLVLGPATLLAQNLIVNGSFEDGDFSPVNSGSWVTVLAGQPKLTGWTIGGGGVDWHNEAELSPAFDGSRTIDLNRSGGGLADTGTLSQTFATIPGASYELVFHLAGPHPWFPDPRQVEVTVAGATYDASTGVSPQNALEWEEFVIAFTATDAATTLTFASVDGSGYWGPLLDGVSVTALETDGDGDGVLDDDDECPDTEADALVDDAGCSIAQYCPCDEDWKNHGQYVSCVAQAAGDFVELGLLQPCEHGPIVWEAAKSSCGAKSWGCGKKGSDKGKKGKKGKKGSDKGKKGKKGKK
jgi:choice-of-anchor C domain-containing protein